MCEISFLFSLTRQGNRFHFDFKSSREAPSGTLLGAGVSGSPERSNSNAGTTPNSLGQIHERAGRTQNPAPTVKSMSSGPVQESTTLKRPAGLASTAGGTSISSSAETAQATLSSTDVEMTRFVFWLCWLKVLYANPLFGFHARNVTLFSVRYEVTTYLDQRRILASQHRRRLLSLSRIQGKYLTAPELVIFFSHYNQ